MHSCPLGRETLETSAHALCEQDSGVLEDVTGWMSKSVERKSTLKTTLGPKKKKKKKG